MSDAAKKKVKQKWAIKKPKPDNARQLRGIFIIEPNDKEFKHTMKNALRKLEVPKLAAVLGNTRPNILVLSMPTNLSESDWKVCRTGITKITSLQKG